MDLIVYVLVLALLGLVVGALARIALPGPDPMSVWATIGLGLVGTFLGGLITHWLFGDEGPGIVVAVVVATLLLWARRRARGERVQPYNHRE